MNPLPRGLEACAALRALLNDPPPPEIEVMGLISIIEQDLRAAEMSVDEQVMRERGMRCEAIDERDRFRKVMNQYGLLAEVMRDALNP